MKLATTALAAALLALALASCGGETGGETAAADPASLEGPSWILDGGIDVEGWQQAAPGISFAKARVSGSNGCNTFGGSFTTDGSSLELGELVATMKACPPPAAEVERAFTKQLEAASSWRVEGEQLVLEGGGGELRFRSASPEGSWRATAFLQGEAVKSPIPGTEITADIGSEGIQGSSGCNSYSASFEIDGSSISISPSGGTEIACSTPPGVMEQERAYLEALPRAAEWRLEAGNLMLLTAKGTIVATFEPVS